MDDLMGIDRNTASIEKPLNSRTVNLTSQSQKFKQGGSYFIDSQQVESISNRLYDDAAIKQQKID